MPANFLRDIVNLLLYGGAFIGLCAAAITSLTFDLIDDSTEYFQYVLLIGVSTAALYSAHRVIGLRKLEHVNTTERYAVIRKYKVHIWIYCLLWIILSIWFFIPFFDLKFLLLLLPGGAIAFAYVLPFMAEGKRLRDIGWVKILLIGWSWGWLTAFIPAYYFAGIPLPLSILIGIERVLFIIAITIPFEIRDISIDRSVGLVTMPARFGMKDTFRIGNILCAFIILIAAFLAYYFHDPAYFIAMFAIVVLTLWLIRKSSVIKNDYFFSGLTDGTMILVLIVHWALNI